MMTKKFTFFATMLIAALGFNSCASDEQAGDVADELAYAQAEAGIKTKLSAKTRANTTPLETPDIEKISYEWQYPVDIINEFPEFVTPEGVCKNFVYYSNGEPFDLVMLYSNGGYRHKLGIYWYDEDGDCHEKLFWNELDETYHTWYNANGSKSDVISRKSDNAGAYRIQLPKGTKFGFFQESHKQVANDVWELVTEGVRLDPPAGPVVPCPYKFYSESLKNWNYKFTNTGQLMTTELNGWSIVGFEDISLTYPSCDKDYNDCVFAINPIQATEPDPEPSVVDGSVETNLSVAKDKDGNDKVKLSLHVRAITDVEIVLPICDQALADDFNIVAKHDVEYVYSEEMVINDQTVKLNYSITPEGYLKITTKGVNADVIEYCKNTYADGLTFECNLEYGQFDLKAKPTIKFTSNPTFYITSCVTNSPEANDIEVVWDDDTVIGVDDLNFQTTGGTLDYDHKVYSPLDLDELQKRGWLPTSTK